MGRHRAWTGGVHLSWLVPFLAIVLVGAGSAVVKLSSSQPALAPCPDALTVVTASSFAPVLTAVAPAMATGPDCARLEVVPADGRAAAAAVAARGADVWIPDDAAWSANPGPTQLAPAHDGSTAGTVLATSPFYLVTDADTARRATAAGDGWRALDRLVTDPAGPPVTLALRDPAGSGDGLLAAGALGEAVWITDGMDASAFALARALPMTRTEPGVEPALPRAPGEIGLVPEYALLPVLRAGGLPTGTTVLAPGDHTALLRFSWLPTAAAASDPATARVLDRLRDTLTGDQATPALLAAGLRRPDASGPPGEPVGALPPVTAAPFDVLGPHHVDHVFATWYPADRRADVLVAVDVSGSMNARAPGSQRRLIDLVRDGVVELGRLLPNDSMLGLWEFGLRLDPPRDYQELLPSAELTGPHRVDTLAAVEGLRARTAGTGLYDTVLAAYEAARDRHRVGVPNHLVVFTDGHNEFDPGSLTLPQLTERLQQAQDPARPVALSVVAFGDEPDAARLQQALDPVGGYVSQPANADAVGAVIVHVAAGGVHR